MSTRSNQSNKNTTKKSTVIFVDDNNLNNLQARIPLLQYGKEIIDRKDFILAQARAKSFSTGRDMFLGKLWIFLTPIIQIATYALIFGIILNVSRGIDNFLGFLTIGVVFFGFITQSLSVGSGLIRSSKGLITALSFPKASIIFSTVIRMFFDNLIPALVATTSALIFQAGKPISWTILLVIPLYLLIHLFITGLLFISARATAFIPDLKALINVINRGLFFVSGVFFSIDRFSMHPLLHKAMSANPIYQFLKAVRDSVMYGTVPSFGAWVYLTLWSGLLFIFGYIFFWRAEERYSDVK